MQEGGLHHFRAFLKKGRVHKSKAPTPGADFFLHAHDMAQVQIRPLLAQSLRPSNQPIGQKSYSFDPDQGKGDGKHHLAYGLNSLDDERLVFQPCWCLGQIIHFSLGCKGAGGKSGPCQIIGRAADGLGKNRVADQVFIAFLSIDDQIVGIEMKAQRPWKVGQPEHPGLEPHRDTDGKGLIQFRHGCILVAKSFLYHLNAANGADLAEDMAGSGPVGDKGQSVDPDKGQIAEKKAAAHAEGHGLGDGDALMGQQVGGHTAFTVGGLGMRKIRQKVVLQAIRYW